MGHTPDATDAADAPEAAGAGTPDATGTPAAPGASDAAGTLGAAGALDAAGAGRLDTTRAWMADGEAFLGAQLAQLDRLDDAALAASSRLPGWSRAYVFAHLARNADALVNLLTWARTGVETPMYAGPRQRDADIDTGARQPPAALRDDVRASGNTLARAVADLPATAWTARVRSARGRDISATEIPWMRVREVWLHAVDLDTGASCAEFPASLVDALLDDVTDTFTRRGDCPQVRLAATDRTRTWHIGDPSGAVEVSSNAAVAAADVAGTAAELLAWLTGREPGTHLHTTAPATGALPTLPAWL